MDISGRAALISGAAAGIGRATAVALARKGARRIVLVDIDAAGLAETAKLVAEAGAYKVRASSGGGAVARAHIFPLRLVPVASLSRWPAHIQTSRPMHGCPM